MLKNKCDLAGSEEVLLGVYYLCNVKSTLPL